MLILHSPGTGFSITIIVLLMATGASCAQHTGLNMLSMTLIGLAWGLLGLSKQSSFVECTLTSVRPSADSVH